VALKLNLYEKLILQPDSEASHAWVNFSVDTIDIGEEDDYTHFSHCAHKIRRLKFKADVGEEIWCYYRYSYLSLFDNLLECFIVTTDNITDWGGTDYAPPCDGESTFLIQEQTGETKTFGDMDRLREEEEKRQDAEYGKLYT
jgi:hypothetical protein